MIKIDQLSKNAKSGRCFALVTIFLINDCSAK